MKKEINTMRLKMHGDGRKGIAINSLGVAGSALSTVMIGYLTYCLTTSFAMAGTVVGLITLCSRVFDGFTDIIAGFIIDRCHFKIGKARLFDLFNIPMWIFLALCFELPALNTVGKVVFIFVMYNLSQSIFYTFVTVSGTVRLKRTFVEDIRAKVLAICSAVTAIVSTVASILMPLLISIFEKRPHGWLIIISFFAVPGILASLFQFFMLPEMNDVEDKSEGKGTEKVSLKESVKALFQNPYLLTIVLVIMANILTMGITGTVSTYYFRYNMGNLTLASAIGLFSLMGYVFIFIMPIMTKKLGNRKSVMVAYMMVFVGNLAKLVMLKNLFWLMICSTISVVGVTLAVSIRDMILIDSMRYGELKTGVQGEGIYASVRGFSEKVANGLAPFLVGVLLDIGHFNGSVDVQPASATSIITILFTVVPAAIAMVAFIAMYFCRMEDRIKEMEQAKLESNA